jgi:hypothetical protein
MTFMAVFQTTVFLSCMLIIAQSFKASDVGTRAWARHRTRSARSHARMLPRSPLLLASLTLILAISCAGDSDVRARDQVELKRETLSPDGQRAARYYVESGGGAAGWVNEIVDIQEPGDSSRPDARQAVFVMSQGGDVTTRWTSARSLTIEYPAWAGVIRGCRTARGVAITYVAIAKPDSSWGEGARVAWHDDSLMRHDLARSGAAPGPGSYPGLVGTCS